MKFITHNISIKQYLYEIITNQPVRCPLVYGRDENTINGTFFDDTRITLSSVILFLLSGFFIKRNSFVTSGMAEVLLHDDCVLFNVLFFIL